jgi:CAAX prenyl protease-like protein
VGKLVIPNSAAYVLPFVLYLGLTQIAAALAKEYPEYYPGLYAVVVVVTGGVTCFLLRDRGILKPHRDVWAGVLVGLVGIGIWIPLSLVHGEQQLAAHLPEWLRPSSRPGFDPFTSIAQPVARWAFIAVRLLGLAVLVPVAEELFWRGFLLRWLISPDWERQPLGQFSLLSFTVVTLLFTVAHPEWFAAAVYCALLNGLIYWKRDLWNCVVAHAVSNLVLGVYVLATGTWELW